VPEEPGGSLPGSWRCGRRRSSTRRTNDLRPARRPARWASARATSRSSLCLPAALSAGLLPKDIVCPLRELARS